MPTLNYATVGSNNLEKAKTFYDELFRSVSISKIFDHPSGGRVYGSSKTFMFSLVKPHDEKPASVGNGSMIAFSFDTTEEVDNFYAKAIALGGADEGAPGERGANMHFCYFRDLDGNKLCGYCMNP